MNKSMKLPEYFLTNCDLGDENDWGSLGLVVREHERVYLDYQTWLMRVERNFKPSQYD